MCTAMTSQSLRRLQLYEIVLAQIAESDRAPESLQEAQERIVYLTGLAKDARGKQ
jgi:hypothetical protein